MLVSEGNIDPARNVKVLTGDPSPSFGMVEMIAMAQAKR